MIEKNNDMFVCDEKLSNTMLYSQDRNSQYCSRFVNTHAHCAKRKILLNNRLLKYGVRNVIKNNTSLDHAILTNISLKDLG